MTKTEKIEKIYELQEKCKEKLEKIEELSGKHSPSVILLIDVCVEYGILKGQLLMMASQKISV